jgi:Mn-dependent DtxR family transcriptional regulator
MPRTQSTLHPLARQTLIALYELHALGQPVHAGSLAARLGVSASSVGAALCELDAKRLVWLSRCALTIPGLALAARLARRQQMRSHAA